MKKILLFAMAISPGCYLHAQTRMDKDYAVARFQTYYNANQPDSIYAMFGQRMQQMAPMDKTSQMITALKGQVGNMTGYEFLREEKPFTYYKVTFEHAPLYFIMNLSQEQKMESFRMLPSDPGTAAKATPKEQSNFVYESAAGKLYGTLSVPAVGKKMPVVLVIAGSGPTDRNGNQDGLLTNCYKMIADSLMSKGIACLRYDKRGAGESATAMKSEESMTFDNTIDDAVGIIKQLKADGRFSKVVILGHSEGSLVGMIAAQKEKVNGFISLSGAGEPLGKILVRQITAQSAERGARAKEIIDSIMHGYTVNAGPDFFAEFRPSVQPYIRSFFSRLPQEEIKKVNTPTLILQGNTDIQVSVLDAELLKKAYPKGKLHIIKGMNHVLKQAPENREENIATYNNGTLPLSAGLMPPIYTFINETK